MILFVFLEKEQKVKKKKNIQFYLSFIKIVKLKYKEKIFFNMEILSGLVLLVT